jgi:signal transduction histidine kinase
MQKEKREIVYAIITIATIPLLILANTLYLVSSVKKSSSVYFSEKADVLNTVMIESLRDEITNKNYIGITNKLNSYKRQQPVLSKLYVLQENDNQIGILAKSDDSDAKLSPNSSMAAKIAYEKKLPVARFTKVINNGHNVNAWNITTPLTDKSSGKVVALLNSTILPGDAENMINRNLFISIIFVIISIVIIFLLLFRHFRFVEYARLLVKQREINQTMSNFLSVATHELKAPATIIKGYISNTLEDETYQLPQSVKDQLNIALSQTDRLNNLVKDLLNVSHIEQGKVEYTITDFNVADVINPIIKNYQMIAAEKNIQVISNIEPAIYMRADSGRTQEIFTNLIDNAVKYSQNGTITIAQASSDNYIAISVRDTGIGIDPEHKKQLFQRFYRVRNEKTKDISGTGLGLWIVKQYIESMGGKIELNSMENVGSEFIVYLPKSQN